MPAFPSLHDRIARPSRRAFIVAGLLGTLGACASTPSVGRLAQHVGPVPAKPKVVGARGPLDAKQVEALLDRLGAGRNDLLKRHLAVEQAVAETPLVTGNATRLLRDGGEAFAATFAAIRGARHHVNLEYYILEDVQHDGEHLSDLLVAKRGEGVEVNVIYDSFGALETPKPFFDRLRAAGVQLVEFNPLNPLDAKAEYSLNKRDHRKILVVDGTTAIVGGVNLSTSYESFIGGLSGRGSRPVPPRQYWRDTDVEIRGPVVAQLQHLFLDHWASQKGPVLKEAEFFPKLEPQGKEVVRIIGSSPSDELPRYYVTLLSAIRIATERVWVSTAYFVPTEDELRDLQGAARRGVDVRLLVPSDSDSRLALAVQHSHYEDLLEAGVKIYELRNEVLHSKTIVIDGVWSVVGSSNFDHRSVIYNDEVDAVLLGADTGAQMEAMFRDDLRVAKPVDLGAWRRRPIGDRIEETFSRLWENLL